MSTGDAIIVSTLLVIVATFAWRISIAHRWGTVGKVFLALFLLFTAIIAGAKSYQWYQKRPKIVENLSGIKIGMIEAEVVVKMGSPDSVNKQQNHKIISYRKEYNYQYGLDILISSKTNKIETICEKGEFTDPYLDSYISEYELIDRFGEPEITFIKPDGSYKSLSYPNYNLTFIIRSGSMSEVCLSNKAQDYLA